MSHVQPHPGFFAVLATPRAYATLLYLLLSLGLGLLAFTYATTGLALSLGLAVLIIGVPFALAFLAGVRVLSVLEGRLLQGLVDPSAPGDAPLLPEGAGLARVKHLVTDRRTWSSLLYLLLRLPLGLVAFTSLVSLLATALALLAVPAARLLQAHGTLAVDGIQFDGSGLHPDAAVILCGLAGLVLLPAAFHLALLLGRFQVWLASHLLVTR